MSKPIRVVRIINRECDNKYICTRCGKTTAGITGEIEYTIKEGNYLSCMHCGKRLEYPYKHIKECMDHSTYEVRNGVIKQKRR